MPTSTVYARKEPTDDTLVSQTSQEKRGAKFTPRYDVQVYRDKTCQDKMGRFPWHYTKSMPTRRNKYIMLNCSRWKLVWLPPVK